MIGHAGLLEALLPVRLARDEHRHAVDHRDAGLEDLLGVPLRRGLGADREVVDDDVGARLLEDLDDVGRLARCLLDDLGEVLADAVVRHAARDRDARLRHVGELDRVVRVRPDRVGEVDADLALDDVERGRELDVGDVVAAEVDVHEPRDERVTVGVLVVLDALEEGVGAVADADDGDAHLVLRAGLAVCRAVGSGHGCVLSAAAPEWDGPAAVRLKRNAELIRERGEDDIVRVGAEAERLGLDHVFQLLRHAEQHDGARARKRAATVRRLVVDAEPLGENADRDVVQAGTTAGRLADERLLEGGRGSDEDALAW